MNKFFWLFLWLAISGGVIGRHQPLLLLINFSLMILIIGWAMLISNALGRAVGVMWAIFLAIGVMVNGSWAISWARYLELLACWSVYQVFEQRLNVNEVEKGATKALLMYIPLALIYGENTNVVAMNVWALLFLSGGGLWGVAGVVIVFCGSAGGVIALAMGMGKLLKPNTMLVVIFCFMLVMFNVTTGLIRFELVKIGWEMFSQFPIVGGGVGSFRGLIGNWGAISSHNIFIDILAEGGIMGGAVFGVGVLWVLRQGPWPYLLAFMGHGLVDSPHLFYLPMFGLIISKRVYDVNLLN